MDTFLWLTLGHLVGDWLLQNDWMARKKRERFLSWAGLLHFTIYTAAVTGALWLSDARDGTLVTYFHVGAVVFLSHWLIDGADLAGWWMRFYRQSDLQVVRVMVDQTFHLLVLALLTVLLLDV
jgi:hypothetical protein